MLLLAGSGTLAVCSTNCCDLRGRGQGQIPQQTTFTVTKKDFLLHALHLNILPGFISC